MASIEINGVSRWISRSEEGQAIALELLGKCDILVENFKVGALAKYGLGYEQLHAKFPGLVYCSHHGVRADGAVCDAAGV